MTVYDTYNRLEIEITSKCNARCPGCSRTYKGELHPGLTIADLSADAFIARIPNQAFKNKRVEFCGVFGDPAMHNELHKIAEYIKESGADSIHIDTNGGMQKPEYWERLAKLGVTVHWSVDGYRESNHLYRVNTNFDKILENMKAFCNAGGKGSWEYLVFDHNEKDLPLARAESNKLGLDFMERRNNRNIDYWTSYIKEKQDGKVITKKFNVVQGTRSSIQEEQTTNKQKKDNDFHIKCLYLNEKKLFMGFDGRIWPCCWFHDLYNGDGNPNVLDGKVNIETHHKLQKLDKIYGVGWNSIFYNTWEDILGHEYYTKVLPNTFDSNDPNYNKENAIPKCFTKCKNSGKARNVEYHWHHDNEITVFDGNPEKLGLKIDSQPCDK
jgi:MoaA/NifB/PqqE/SkfB family radical SAM enzyme